MKYVRQATLSDLSEISAIFEDAKKVLSNDGSSQWQNGSPSIENFKKDIEDGCCYVLIVDEEVAGMASFQRRWASKNRIRNFLTSSNEALKDSFRKEQSSLVIL